MPYRRVGKTVQVKRGDRWVKLKAHPSVNAAKKHVQALRINVRH